jgi:hypothetical protein
MKLMVAGLFYDYGGISLRDAVVFGIDQVRMLRCQI